MGIEKRERANEKSVKMTDIKKWRGGDIEAWTKGYRLFCLISAKCVLNRTESIQ